MTTDAATSCSRYDGSVKVGFSKQGDNHSALQAGNTALTVVTRDMIDGSYLEDANVELATKAEMYGDEMPLRSQGLPTSEPVFTT